MSPPNASLILIMVCFWLTFWLVQRFLIRPIWGVLSERKGRIDSAQQAWKAKNEEHLAATARLESELEGAAREAARVRGEQRQRAQAERQQRIARGRAEADGRLQVALDGSVAMPRPRGSSCGSEPVSSRGLLAGKLLGREVTP